MGHKLAGWWMVHALGWTLLHFCWEGTIVALFLWCVLRLLGGRSSQARYMASACALVLMVAAPLVTFARLATDEYRMVQERAGSRVVMDAGMVLWVGAGEPAASWPVRAAAAVDHWMPWILLAWFTGVLLYLGRLNLGLIVAQQLKFKDTDLPSAELRQAFERLKLRLGVTRAVRLMHSAVVHVPTVIGWLRPVVLIPVGCFAGLSPGQVEAILCHELAHVRRHDYLVSVFQSVVEALLFYHPGVWWVSRQLRRERECCCDELAVEAGGDVLAYARALSYLEERRAPLPEFALGANGGVLKMRIGRLLGTREDAAGSPFAAFVVLGVVFALAGSYLVTVARAQPKAAEAAPSASVAEGSTSSVQGSESTQTMETVYKQWLNQDVRWIITSKEAAAFQRLTNDDERDQFIRQFWERRNPPGSPPNTFKEEYYGRIAYANVHFGDGTRMPGWKTDRGHVYLVDGKPDEIEAHPGGGGASSYPYEIWRYRSIPGIGENVELNFVDTGGHGDYHYTVDGLSAQGAQNGAGFESAANTAKILAPPQMQPTQATEASIGTIEGTVVDPTGAVVPRASVTAINTDTGTQVTLETDNSGKFYLASLPTGNYLVEVVARGFQREVQTHIRVAAGEQVDLKLKLAVGAATESLTVTGAQSAGAASPRTAVGPIRVSSGVEAKQVLSQPAPVYPPIAKAAHVQGVVVLHAILSKTGTVEDLQVVSGPPMLVASAMDAVRKWTYKPYLLNGQPTAVETTIKVNYTFGGGKGAAPAPPSPIPDASNGVPAASPTGGRPIRVSSGVAAGMAISQPEPVYPPEAKAKHIRGTVVLHAVVSKTGDIEDLQVISGPKELMASALDAVSQWKYKPYLLNGEPTAVETTIQVHFTLEDDTAPKNGQAGPGAGNAAVRRIGGGVSAPLVMYQVEPEYTRQARKAKFMGVVLVNLIVDAKGHPQNVHVVRGVGMGLDQNAVAAVSKYRFRPAMEDGKPVPVKLNVEVNFQIF